MQDKFDYIVNESAWLGYAKGSLTLQDNGHHLEQSALGTRYKYDVFERTRTTMVARLVPDWPRNGDSKTSGINETRMGAGLRIATKRA
jgi:hypothetical protein